MAFIDTVPVAQAAGDVQALYAQSERDLGYVSNFSKLISSSRKHPRISWKRSPA